MSNDDPTPGFPFAGGPFFGDLLRMLQAQGPISWDAARQLAASIATEGKSEPNVDPRERIALEELGRLADLHVNARSNLSTVVGGRSPVIAPVTRTMWASRTLDAYRPLLEAVASSLGKANAAMLDEAQSAELGLDNEGLAWLNNVSKMMQPMMLGLTAGGLIGHLASRTLGTFDLPIPRPGVHEVMVVVPNLDEFANDWSLPHDDLRLWVCLHELLHFAVLNVPHVQARLLELLTAYANAFEPDPHALQERLGDLDLSAGPEAFEQLQATLGDPDIALGAVQSAAQRAMLPQLAALSAAIVGYVDHVMDDIGGRLISSYRMLTEALRRRRVEADASDRFVERIFGLELTQAHYDRAHRFASGVVERAGEEGLDRLWESARTLPTPNEVDAPGLWLARVELPD